MTALAPASRRTKALGLSGLALLVLVLAVALTGAVPETIPGIPDPGPVTSWGLPVIGLVTDLAAVATVACLLVPLLVLTKLGAGLDARTTRATRAARHPAFVWLAATAAEAWWSVSDQFAVGVSGVRFATLRAFLTDTPQGLSLSVQFVLVLLVALAARWVNNARETLIVLLFGLAALVPALLTGHSASSGSHDTAVVSLTIHVLVAVVWVAGVVALWFHLGAREDLRERATARFSRLAAWCFGLTAASGFVAAWVRLGSFGEFFTSSYGRAALLKIAALVVIGVVAVRLRAALRAKSDWRTFAGLTLVETAAMGAAVALGVALSRTPPPVGEPYQSLAESLLGGPLPPAPDAANLLWSFQLSGVGLTVVALGAVGYLAGLRTLRRRGDAWAFGRTISWFLGLLAIGYATMGGLGVYSHTMFSAHMVSHMVLSMLAPVLLVLGSPITLALRALPGPDVPGNDGPRQILLWFLNSRWSRIVTNPAFATIVFVGSLYGIYFTGLYEWLMGNHLGHALMEVHFLLAGYLYYEILIGTSPLPKRLPYLGRLGLTVLVAPFHAFFAVGVMSTTTLIGGDYYGLIDRGWSTDLLADQELGGGLTWALGEIPLLLVAVVLLFQWFRDDSRRARQHDRQAARDNDAELDAYNAMLARIASGNASRADRDPVTRASTQDTSEAP